MVYRLVTAGVTSCHGLQITPLDIGVGSSNTRLMSIEKMISEHPDVSGHVNEGLAKAIRHIMYCSAICASCADACVAEPGDMRQCIRNCLDCADICSAGMRVGLRRTAANERLIASMLELVTQACARCVEECSKHDNPHCQRCATMCHEVIEDIRAVRL